MTEGSQLKLMADREDWAIQWSFGEVVCSSHDELLLQRIQRDHPYLSWNAALAREAQYVADRILDRGMFKRSTGKAARAKRFESYGATLYTELIRVEDAPFSVDIAMSHVTHELGCVQREKLSWTSVGLSFMMTKKGKAISVVFLAEFPERHIIEKTFEHDFIIHDGDVVEALNGYRRAIGFPEFMKSERMDSVQGLIGVAEVAVEQKCSRLGLQSDDLGSLEFDELAVKELKNLKYGRCIVLAANEEMQRSLRPWFASCEFTDMLLSAEEEIAVFRSRHTDESVKIAIVTRRRTGW